MKFTPWRTHQVDDVMSGMKKNIVLVILVLTNIYWVYRWALTPSQLVTNSAQTPTPTPQRPSLETYKDPNFMWSNDLECVAFGKADGMDYQRRIDLTFHGLLGKDVSVILNSQKAGAVTMKRLQETDKAMVLQYISNTAETTTITITKKSGFLGLAATSIDAEFGSIASGYCKKST